MDKESLLVLPDYCKDISMSEDLYDYLSEDHRLRTFSENAKNSKDHHSEEFNWFKILFALMDELKIGHPTAESIYAKRSFIREISKVILSIRLVSKTHFQEIPSKDELIRHLKGLEELPVNLIDPDFIKADYHKYKFFQARQYIYDTTYIVRLYSEDKTRYSENSVYSNEIYTIVLNS